MKNRNIFLIACIFIILISITASSAQDNETATDKLQNAESDPIMEINEDETPLSDDSTDLKTRIDNADNGEEIIIEPGTYKIHNVHLTKNITLQGNGNARDIIIDGEEKSSIFLINNPNVRVTFKNITFINGLTKNFGGAISIETGGAVVDNCIFINNTALDNTNAGGISNYGTKKNRGYLLVNNSIFINNHADHDGGAITTCYADSYIYNCVFINNSAVRDGGAIRVSVFGYGDVQDCIFMFNHADEWGGAYYSWSGESNIERCIFMNNTAGTNGGAVMVSGNINIEDSIIVNNDGGETGGSFYIQQPMYDTKTVINVHNNIITNNSSPYGKEIFIKWWDSYNLYTQFDNNDWGDEDPNDPSVNDPNNVTSRSKVSKTIKSDLFGRLNVDLLDKYNDLIKDFFTEDSMNNLKNQFYKIQNNKTENNPDTKRSSENPTFNKEEKIINDNIDKTINNNSISNEYDSKPVNFTSNNPMIVGNSTSHGNDEKAYELNETEGGSVVKQTNLNLNVFIAIIVIVMILLVIGYRRQKRLSE